MPAFRLGKEMHPNRKGLTAAILLAAAVGGAAAAYGPATELYRAKAAKMPPVTAPSVTVPVSPAAVRLRGSQDESAPVELRRETPEAPRKTPPPKRQIPVDTQLAAL